MISTSDRHASIMAELRSVEKDKQNLGMVTRSTLNDVQNEILEIVKKQIHIRDKVKQKTLWGTFSSHKHFMNMARDIRISVPHANKSRESLHRDSLDDEVEKEEIQLATQVQQLTNALIKLKVVQREQATSAREVEVVRSLHFTEVFRRFEKINKADASSNEWVFDPQQTTLSRWLESQDNADGLYYIFGKVSFRTRRTVTEAY